MNITIRPLGREHFAALLNDRLLCESRTPFLSAARILQREGIPEDTIITMTHEGSATVAMQSTVGKAAGLTVLENDKKGPCLKPYRALSADRPSAGVGSGSGTAESNLQVDRPCQHESQLLRSDPMPSCFSPNAVLARPTRGRRPVRPGITPPIQLSLLLPTQSCSHPSAPLGNSLAKPEGLPW
jgi:hypothetical protein